MALSRLAALLPMRWLSNVRLPQAKRCSHGANQRWRIGLDDDDLINLVEPLPAGSRAAGPGVIARRQNRPMGRR